MAERILIVDDDALQRRPLAQMVEALGYRVEQAAGGQAALDRIRDDNAAQLDLVLLDLMMPEVGGKEVLHALRNQGRAPLVIILTADGSISTAVDAMRAGACDFLIKPVGPERLAVSVRNALELSCLSSEVRRLARMDDNRLSFDELVAVAPATRETIALARRAAGSDIPVLIEGESGTGKEIFARAIHGSSDRGGKPFVAVNCGALPVNLVESILFGHEKGAFTGATTRRSGRFQEADGGTLFLDEVGELPPDIQVKLLRALQSGEVDPVGASAPVKVDIRLISATNRDLKDMIAARAFREDLYYRLGVFELRLPPLRERREDLPGLARMFLKRFAASESIRMDGFTHQAMEAIARAPWPGNVRQLENAIHRAVVMTDGHLIRPRDLHGIDVAAIALKQTEYDMARVPTAQDVRVEDPFLKIDGHVKRLLEIEADAIRRALVLYRGRMSETARRLGIGRSTLYRKLDELQIDRTEPVAPTPQRIMPSADM